MSSDTAVVVLVHACRGVTDLPVNMPVEPKFKMTISDVLGDVLGSLKWRSFA